MKKMTANEIRSMWLNFFKSKGHNIEESSSLIPADDPTLLWTNAGVSPLKKYFDGSLKPINPRITNAQKCIRTNDIENVGLTARHHTFFEMLGNFSIGDYFKEEAIEFAFELLFSDKWFGFPLSKIYITYYPSDTVCKDKWLSLGISEDHLIPLDGNFWEIGDGPCGPDTEIFYDRGEAYDKRGVELIRDDLENDRFIEIWNIVFSQFNAKEGLKREEYKELPSKNIDTGSGLERLCLVMQGVKTNYETDLFLPIIEEIAKISGHPYDDSPAFKVIADHVRTVVFALADGAMISNEGRGYVLRRLLRRAMKFARKLDLYEPFMYKLVDVVITVMEDFYPYLIESASLIKRIIKEEEVKFLATLKDGEKKLFDLASKHNSLSSEDAFLLYDTYGFPIELTKEYSDENNIKLDLSNFNKLLEEQKEKARSARKNNNSMNLQNEEFLEFKAESQFFYDVNSLETSVIKVFKEGIVLKETPFYATSGGQEADFGVITTQNSTYQVLDVIKLPNGQHLHVLDASFKESEGVTVKAHIDEVKRYKTMLNHSSCHLLQSALKSVLGDHTHQLGQNVNDQQFRFDFNHFEPLTDKQILAIEDLVNSYIKEAHDSKISVMPISEAKQLGAIALFNEKYGDFVRVVDLGVSIEFCSGTHVKNTSMLKRFNIINYESIGSGVFRLEGYCGADNKYLLDKHAKKVSDLKVLNEELGNNYLLDEKLYGYRLVLDLKSKLAIAEAELSTKKKAASEKAKEALVQDLEQYRNLIKANSLVLTLAYENDEIKLLIDSLFNKYKLENCIVIKENGSNFVVYLKSRIDSKTKLNTLLAKFNGKGGGKDTFAQGKVTCSYEELYLEAVKLCELSA